MLKFDIHPLLKLKGATKLMAYLYNRGLSVGRAHHLISKNVKTIAISDIEKLCHIFNCTPNDLFTFEESAAAPLAPNSALKKLIRVSPPSVTELVGDLSLEEANELLFKMAELKKQK
jgi:DNA-binding Xre family transcriptional regulator